MNGQTGSSWEEVCSNSNNHRWASQNAQHIKTLDAWVTTAEEKESEAAEVYWKWIAVDQVINQSGHSPLTFPNKHVKKQQPLPAGQMCRYS